MILMDDNIYIKKHTHTYIYLLNAYSGWQPNRKCAKSVLHIYFVGVFMGKVYINSVISPSFDLAPF